MKQTVFFRFPLQPAAHMLRLYADLLVSRLKLYNQRCWEAKSLNVRIGNKRNVASHVVPHCMNF